MLAHALWGRFAPRLAVDLGTANTLVFAAGMGIVVDEPSIVALGGGSKRVAAVGSEAKEMLGRAPCPIVKPVKNGVISDFKVTEWMLHHFIRQARRGRHFLSPKVVISVPCEATAVERSAVLDATHRAGAGDVRLVNQSLAAAAGAGLPIEEPSGQLLLDIGGGTTDVAVISLGDVVYSRSIHIAGNAMDDAIIDYIKHKYDLLIGERTAEAVKMDIGSASPLARALTMQVRGRDAIRGIPKAVEVNDTDIREALEGCLKAIACLVREAFERTPPELCADIVDKGVVVTGGCALLKNLDARLRKETGLPVSLAAEPLASVVLGTGKTLTDAAFLRKTSVN